MIKTVEDKRIVTLNSLLSERYREEWGVAELRREFARNDYVKLQNWLNTEALERLTTEVRLIEAFAHPNDFVMDAPGCETPRIMTTIGGEEMMCSLPKLRLDTLPILGSLYTHHDVWRLVEGIVGAPIYPCLHPDEFMVCNYLVKPGNTHGWHLDDPAYALVIIIEAPDKENGGILEYIRDWRTIREENCISPSERIEEVVEHCRAVHLVNSRHHQPGDAYLLRADQCLHRVTPLESNGISRIVLNLGFEATPEPVYGTTATRLYRRASSNI